MPLKTQICRDVMIFQISIKSKKPFFFFFTLYTTQWFSHFILHYMARDLISTTFSSAKTSRLIVTAPAISHVLMSANGNDPHRRPSGQGNPNFFRLMKIWPGWSCPLPPMPGWFFCINWPQIHFYIGRAKNNSYHSDL